MRNASHNSHKVGVYTHLALGYPDKDERPILQHVIQVEDRLHYNKW